MAMPFMNTVQHPAGGSVTLLNDPNSLGNKYNLQAEDSARLRRYDEHWRFYAGKHWQFEREEGDPQVVLNYFKKCIDKAASFLVSEGFNIKVHDTLVDITAPFLAEVWKRNKSKTLVWDMALTGGVTGDVFMLVYWEEPTVHDMRVHPYSQGRIRVVVVPSERVFPVWDPNDADKMLSVRIETYVAVGAEPDAPGVDVAGANDTTQLRRYTQVITPTKITKHMEGEQPIVQDNLLGEIPVVHIKNMPSPGDAFGMPDGLEIIDVNKLINEKATDVSDVVNYNAFPTTVITGAKASGLERGYNKMWSGLPTDSKVFNLESPSNLGSAHEFVAFAKEALMELSDTPEQSLGKMQPISNTSGVALHLQYMPLMEKTKKKRPFYEYGIERVNYFILRIAQIKGLIELPFDIDKRSGGKIALVNTPQLNWNGEERTQEDGTPVTKRVPRSFEMNRETLDFMDPLDMKVKFVRQYSFGHEIREVPYWQAVAEYRKVSKSFWDPAPERSLDDPEGPDTDENEPAPYTPQIPAEQINVPPEPEEVEMVVQFYDPLTNVLLGEKKTSRTLVPTGNSRPEYLNPYETEVDFNDPLPKDMHLDAQLFEKFQNNGWVSRRWCQQNISIIAPNIDEIERDREREGAQAAARFQGNPNKKQQQTEMQGEELERDTSSVESPSVDNRGKDDDEKDDGEIAGREE